MNLLLCQKKGFGACTKTHDWPLNGGAPSIRKLGETYRGEPIFAVYGAGGVAPMLLTIGPNVTEKARRALYRAPTANSQIFLA